MFTLFYAIGADVEAEKHGNFGSADFVVKSEDQSWVIEMKVSHDDKDSQKLAEAAITQIEEKNLGGGYLTPFFWAGCRL
ncbi:MAG: PD-(D/E)XK nuclease domain-containing protein [Deltaproteobacteria bacterium]|nr:PD-(D/E)XK nuclease domain-containing protein [Deltaproteobacteria bacterium]